MRVLALAALSAGLLAADFAAATSQPIPLEDFIRRPSYSGVRISPTGEYLALTADRGEQDVLVVLRTKDLSPVKVNQLPDDKSVGQFAWVGPNRLMFGATTKSGSLEAPRSTGEWYAVNADGSDPRPIIFYGTRTAAERSKAVGAQSFTLLDPLIGDDSKVLMAAYYPRGRESSGVEVVEVDTFAGRRKVLAKAPRGNCGIALDETKQPRYAVCTDAEDAEGNFDTQTELYRREDDGKWTLLNRSKDGGLRLEVMGTAKDGRVYAMRGDGKAPSAFGVLDRQTGAFTELFHDKVSDVAYNIMATDNETIIGVVTMAGKPNITLVEETHPDAELYASLAASFPGQFVNFSSATADGKQIVVSVISDRNPGQLYLYDRDSGKARFLMQSRSWIDPEKMATMKPFSFVNRDGMRLYGYLTIPAGSDGKNLPMIVNPHGGPMGPRDIWGFNTETQIFASRGYMTLQVNFRGSGGFGKAFEDMAYGQWATGIMHDIVDATRWAIEQGHADKDRICIYGGSFGGYSSMMAPVVAPELYKCAFGYVGNYSAAIQLKLSDTSKSEYGRRYQMRAYGETEAEQTAMSPITHASKLKLPIYLAAGARDPRCPPENTTAMFKALKDAGNEPEGMIIASGEMHGFYKEENNLKLYSEMLAFFDRHIGRKDDAVAQQ